VNELRHERERRGWSLDDVSSRTRIPRPYLEALEDGNHDVLPPGPFFRGYLRQYLEFLGQTDESEERTEADQTDLDQQIEQSVAQATSAALESTQRVPMMRLGVIGFLLTLVAVLGFNVYDRVTATPTTTVNGVVVPIGPPHIVRIKAIEDVHMAVITDGKLAYDKRLQGGSTLDFKAISKLELEISDLTRVRVHYNDKRIEPLGRQTRGRRLVFMHEALD
jgi:transcriptional regulator with XRE-family HTH domain